MRRNIMIVAGLVLLATALIAVPVSAGSVQGNANVNGCQGQCLYQNSAVNAADAVQGFGYCFRNLEAYCYQNSEGLCECQNGGVRPLDGTGEKYGQNKELRKGNNAGKGPCGTA